VFLPQPFPGNPASILVPEPARYAVVAVIPAAPIPQAAHRRDDSLTTPVQDAIAAAPSTDDPPRGDGNTATADVRNTATADVRNAAPVDGGNGAPPSVDGVPAAGQQPVGRIGRPQPTVERRPFGPTISEPAVALRRGRPAHLRESR
jgi:hypothetical protein